MKNATKRKLFVGAASIVCLLCYVWFSCGIYSDREFGGLHVFLKHRIYYRFVFYSPHGESDTPNTTDADRSAEHDYTEFVEIRGGRERSLTLIQ